MQYYPHLTGASDDRMPPAHDERDQAARLPGNFFPGYFFFAAFFFAGFFLAVFFFAAFFLVAFFFPAFFFGPAFLDSSRWMIAIARSIFMACAR